MANKVLAILFLYWYWYGPYFYQQVLIMFFEPENIQYFSAILSQKFEHHYNVTNTTNLMPQMLTEHR